MPECKHKKSERNQKKEVALAAGAVIMRDMKTPTVHLNGTSRDELESQLTTALDAARVLISALESAGPNARDYYPQGEGAFSVARTEHTARLNSIVRVREELYAMLESVS